MMESTQTSSQEKLDQMFHDGTITEEDYLRLSEAMAESSVRRNAEKETGAERGRLCKNWENGLVGGLCAGYADYFGVDARLVRTIVIVATVLLFALSGAGLLLIIAYFGLCVMIPWNEEEKAKAFAKSGHPRRFMGAVACLFFLVPLLYSVLCVPRLEALYSAEETSAEFHSIAKTAIDVASEYRGMFRQLFSSQFDHQMISLMALALAVLFILFLGVIYRSFCKTRVRGYYANVTMGLGLAWLLFLIAGTLYPLLTIA